jgi:bifunctional UDP-N-acetylglucosamine pyrophosphorylase/glucosamine-1-phosphate N-acetyltransferase
MKSARHKVLHAVAGKPMLHHVLDAVAPLAPAAQVVVVGALASQVEAALAGRPVHLAHQAAQLGTGHAVLQAQQSLADFTGTVLILFGDVPLVTTPTLAALAAALTDDTAIAVLGFRPAEPGSYGRVLADGDRVRKMVEYRDATPQERAETLCNAGLMAVHSANLWRWLAGIGNANAAGEYYLPDIVALALAEGRHVRVIEAAAQEVTGVNSRAELARAEALWQARRRAQLMADGVHLVAPETVFLSHDTEIAADVTVEPFIVFGPGVKVATGARIRAHSHIEGADIGPDGEIGPFARLRPGTRLEKGAKIGNFVETKNAHLGAGAKANHLSYIGDASVGAAANIGAGTITCNYDGHGKYRTEIGAGAFIGSNSALVAPVAIGAGAIVGAGSTITRDVSPDALALVRPAQVEKPGWAARFHAMMRAKKKG